MPSLKEFRVRIESVQSTRKITSAMKMVAASKLRRAQEARYIQIGVVHYSAGDSLGRIDRVDKSPLRIMQNARADQFYTRI